MLVHIWERSGLAYKETHRYLVTQTFFSENLERAETSRNAIALLRLEKQIRDEESYLPVCEETLRQGDVIGVTGIGSTSRKQFVFPGPFQEGLFRVNYLQKGFVLLVDRLHFCDERDICTDKIGDVNTCVGDVGSPVYQFGSRISHQKDAQCCEMGEPKCVYGMVKPIATNYRDELTGEIIDCTGEETFINVTHMLPWIRQVMRRYKL
ncbi:uncharacterized protein LOC142345530 [Convolutriloba macropyga]|uniref:uncharacterized protein LOC142345530 n=1 Tax=Convolutriloba macropyga TaxID=536237 RepID=UPI003F528C05